MRCLVAVLTPIVAGLIIRSIVVAPDSANENPQEANTSGRAGRPVPSAKV